MFIKSFSFYHQFPLHIFLGLYRTQIYSNREPLSKLKNALDIFTANIIYTIFFKNQTTLVIGGDEIGINETISKTKQNATFIILDNDRSFSQVAGLQTEKNIYLYKADFKGDICVMLDTKRSNLFENKRIKNCFTFSKKQKT